MKKIIYSLLVLLSSQLISVAQSNDESFTIYLVRHAEKEVADADMSKNPRLTNCGSLRAESIANFLSAVELKSVYSTDYIRTQKTAEPTSQQKSLTLKSYNPRELEEFAKFLIEQKEDALVVGHSNTTPILAGLLVGEEMKSIDESTYDRIYQVVFYKNSGRLHLLKSSFLCPY